MGRMRFRGCDIWTEGRMLQDDEGIYMRYTNSRLGLLVQGGQVGIRVGTDVTYMPDYRCLHVYVDGELVKQVAFARKEEEIWLPPFSDEDVHVITLHKISEATTNWIQLMDIQVKNGNMLPFDDAQFRYVERKGTSLGYIHSDKALILGDSISCGYGLYQGSYEDYEDGTKCYAYLAMKELGFLTEYVTASGYGMYQDYTGYQEHTIPKIYASNYEFIPDWIVIYLGTNDSYNLHTAVEVNNYKNCYQEFVSRLHGDYPEATFLLVAGGMTSDVNEITAELTKTITEHMGYKAYYVEMPMQNARVDGVAKKDHPSEQTHRKFANVLIEKIREIKE